jgi:hypothetical protein
LAIFFVDGDFAGLTYDYKGWHSSPIHSSALSPLLPPAGAKLTPLLETDGGTAVGDVITPPANSPFTAVGSQPVTGGGFDEDVYLLFAPRTGKKNFVVTGIDVAMGQC